MCTSDASHAMRRDVSALTRTADRLPTEGVTAVSGPRGDADAITSRFRGKSRDTGMLEWDRALRSSVTASRPAAIRHIRSAYLIDGRVLEAQVSKATFPSTREKM